MKSIKAILRAVFDAATPLVNELVFYWRVYHFRGRGALIVCGVVFVLAWWLV